MPKDFNRTRRVAEQMQRDLALLIQQEIKDPRLGMVTVSGVDVSRDLSLAKVYVTVMGENPDIELTLDILQKALPDSFDLLKGKGKLAVISFHSGEDRIVKRLFKKWEDDGIGEIVTKKPILPGESEIMENPRSRSAKLRVIQKT